MASDGVLRNGFCLSVSSPPLSTKKKNSQIAGAYGKRMDGLGKHWNGLDGGPDSGWDEWIVQERNRTKLLRVYYHLPSPTNAPYLPIPSPTSWVSTSGGTDLAKYTTLVLVEQNPRRDLPTKAYG